MNELIGQREYARRKGWSAPYVNKLVKQGRIKLTNGKIDPTQADATLDASRQRPSVKDHTPPLGDLTEAKTLREHYAGLREKLRYERQIGQLAAIGDVERVLSLHNSTVRARLLALPSKLAPKLALCKTPQQVRELLDSEIRDCLDQLAEMPAVTASAKGAGE